MHMLCLTSLTLCWLCLVQVEADKARRADRLERDPDYDEEQGVKRNFVSGGGPAWLLACLVLALACVFGMLSASVHASAPAAWLSGTHTCVGCPGSQPSHCSSLPGSRMKPR